MKKSLMALTALGIGAISLAAMPDAAEAGKRHGWHGGHGKHHFHHRKHWRHGWHHRDGCWFFKKKARHTGKRFWWKKYKECKFGFHGDF
ncbi:MAG: hypothetical protein ACR2PM_02970 [Hyphomicrobiales bacterium]